MKTKANDTGEGIQREVSSRENVQVRNICVHVCAPHEKDELPTFKWCRVQVPGSGCRVLGAGCVVFALSSRIFQMSCVFRDLFDILQ